MHHACKDGQPTENMAKANGSEPAKTTDLCISQLNTKHGNDFPMQLEISTYFDSSHKTNRNRSMKCKRKKEYTNLTCADVPIKEKSKLSFLFRNSLLSSNPFPHPNPMNKDK